MSGEVVLWFRGFKIARRVSAAHSLSRAASDFSETGKIFPLWDILTSPNLRNQCCQVTKGAHLFSRPCQQLRRRRQLFRFNHKCATRYSFAVPYDANMDWWRIILFTSRRFLFYIFETSSRFVSLLLSLSGIPFNSGGPGKEVMQNEVALGLRFIMTPVLFHLYFSNFLLSIL